MSASEAKQVLRKFHSKCGKNIKLSHERRVTSGRNRLKLSHERRATGGKELSQEQWKGILGKFHPKCRKNVKLNRFLKLFGKDV